MLSEYHVAQLNLSFRYDRVQLEQFLQRHDLKMEADLDVAFGVFDEEGVLHACGCAGGSLLKCFAADDALRGQNVLGTLISELMQNRFSQGVCDIFVITRAQNKMLFTGCGFFPLVQTEQLVMLENRPDGPERFCASLCADAINDKTVGALVMNCNPFTKGHRALVEYACAHCDLVHLFVVKEDRSFFKTADRLAMVQAGTADLAKVRVHLSGPYILSGATFPNYFLKQNEDAVALQTELDILLFARRIAPALSITKRFAGAEPLDPVTAVYNDAMRRILPEYGISFVEIERLAGAGAPISASHVRGLLAEKGFCEDLRRLLPDTTLSYLNDHPVEDRR